MGVEDKSEEPPVEGWVQGQGQEKGSGIKGWKLELEIRVGVRTWLKSRFILGRMRSRGGA
jgi:hypothetical protein